MHFSLFYRMPAETRAGSAGTKRRVKSAGRATGKSVSFVDERDAEKELPPAIELLPKADPPPPVRTDHTPTLLVYVVYVPFSLQSRTNHTPTLRVYVPFSLQSRTNHTPTLLVYVPFSLQSHIHGHPDFDIQIVEDFKSVCLSRSQML